MMVSIPGWPSIYCDSCKTIRPLLVDKLPSDATNEHAALDFICGTCWLILATLHSVEVEP